MANSPHLGIWQEAKYCRFWYIIEKFLYLCTIIKNLEDAITKEYRQKVFGFAS